MTTETKPPFPRNWSEMSFDTKLFFAFHFCIILMFAAGEVLSVPVELLIAGTLAAIGLIASVIYRIREGWRWQGADLKRVLGAVGGVALVGLMFVAVGQFGSYTNPRLVPWFIALVGIGTFNALVSLRIVRASEEEFLADVHSNSTPARDELPKSEVVAPKADAANVVRNAVAGTLAAYGFISFFIFIWLDIRWVHLAPTQPVPAQDLLYVHNEHGSYVYFSAFQATTCALMFWTSIPLAFVGMFILPKKNVQKTVRWYAARMTYDKDDPVKAYDWAFWITALLTPPLLYFVGRPFVEMLNHLGFVAGLG